MNRIQRFVGFIYQSIVLISQGRHLRLEVQVKERTGSRGKCAQCHKPSPGYDRLPQRTWQFVPLWAIPVWFCMRRAGWSARNMEYRCGGDPLERWQKAGNPGDEVIFLSV